MTKQVKRGTQTLSPISYSSLEIEQITDGIQTQHDVIVQKLIHLPSQKISFPMPMTSRFMSPVLISMQPPGSHPDELIS